MTGAAQLSGLALRLLRSAALILIYNEVMGGVIRAGSISIGLPWLMYAPVMFAWGVLLFCWAVLPLPPRVWAATGLFGAYVVYSILIAVTRPGMGMAKAVASVAFAVYIWAPVFTGLILFARREDHVIQKHLVIFWGLATIGVVVNKFVPFPWMGATFEVGGREIDVARDWSAGGLTRLAGFSRASYNAANEIAIFSALLLFRSGTRLGWRALVVFSSILAIAFTTSKGPLMLAFVVPCIWAAIRTSVAMRFDALSRWLAKSILWLLMSVVVALPLILRPELVPTLNPSSVRTHESTQFISLSSMGDRAGQMWPAAFALIENDHNWVEWIFGRGLGGIGASQYLFERAKANAADNVFVFTYVTFGIGCVLIGIAVLSGFGRLYRRDPESFSFLFALAVSVLVLGITSSVVDATLPALGLGILIGKGLGHSLEWRPEARFYVGRS